MSQQTGTLLGFVHRRRRGAELFLLVLALVVGAGAYAAVGLGVEGTIPANMVGYGGWLAALVIGAHVVVRISAPYADPVLLPVVAALNGLGLAVIHRLDLSEGTTFARQQLIWMTLGVALFVVTLLVAARPPRAAALHLHPRAGRDPAAAAAAGPRHRRDRQRRPDLDPAGRLQLPARRGRQGAAGDRVRRLPRPPPRRARAGRTPGAVRRPPPRPRPRPDPRDVAGQPRHPGLPARPRLQPAVLRPVPGDALRRHRAARLAGRRRPRCSSAAPPPSTTSPRPPGSSHTSPSGSTSGSTRSPTTARAPTTARSSRSRRCSGWAGAG